MADEFVTVCDKWGVSGDYHEFAFGPARDKAGQLLHHAQRRLRRRPPGEGRRGAAGASRSRPKGKLEPFAYGLRSPNGINFSPDGDLFYCDNQGEWVATNKMHHLKPGQVLRPPGRAAVGQGFAVRGQGAGQGRQRHALRRHQLGSGTTGRTWRGPSRFTRTSTRRASGSPTAAWASPRASRSGTRPAASSARSPGSASSATRPSRASCAWRWRR